MMKHVAGDLSQEEQLGPFKLAEPSPELRERVLSAARSAWNKSEPVAEWRSFYPCLLALAATLLLCIGASWLNRALVASDMHVTSRPQAPALPRECDVDGLSGSWSMERTMLTVSDEALSEALKLRQKQWTELFNSPNENSAPLTPNRQTEIIRQKSPQSASCC